MRILHLLASPAYSGPAENVALLATAQRALGHEVAVAVDRKRATVSSEEPSAPRMRKLGLLDEGGLELSVKSSPAAVLRDVRALRRRAVDVVHSHFSHDHFVARFGRPKGAKLVRSIHAPRSIRLTLPSADAFTVSSQTEVSRLPGKQVMVLPALVAPEFRPPRSRPALRRELQLEGDPVIGMASTFQPSRRHGLGLEAFSRLRRERPGARMVLLGDGELEPELRQQVARLGLLPAVIFAGYQRGEAYVRWLQSLDELWVLGLGNDFSGRVAAQARACEVKVVAMDEGALATLADALVTRQDPALVASASLSSQRMSRNLPASEE
ncbi:MAG: glycosyltransferase, partial [Myxococcales bacterium]|nr:glycosyltransferase [Myxococcales bacterium]